MGTISAAGKEIKSTGIISPLDNQKKLFAEEVVGLCTGEFTFYPLRTYGSGTKPLYTITITVKTESEEDCIKWGGGATLTMTDKTNLDVVSVITYIGK